MTASTNKTKRKIILHSSFFQFRIDGADNQLYPADIFDFYNSILQNDYFSRFTSGCPFLPSDRYKAGLPQVVYFFKHNSFFPDQTLSIRPYPVSVEVFLSNRPCEEQQDEGDSQKSQDL